jgi:hypothetical protein
VVGDRAAAVLSFVARNRVDATVRDLARAPVGCDTTLEFSDTGTFVVFVETAGRIDGLSGGCDAPTRYDRRAASTPRVTIELVDPSGRDVPIDPTDRRATTSEGSGRRRSARSPSTQTGRHVVRVTSPEGGRGGRVGRDPAAGCALTAAALAVAAVGVSGEARHWSSVSCVAGARRPRRRRQGPRRREILGVTRNAVSPSVATAGPTAARRRGVAPVGRCATRPGAPLPPPTGPRYG